jgi:nitrogen-specific signal transduction histidine kinase
MNTDYWIDSDINPCISFDVNGEIKYLNNVAETLFAYTDKKDIFDMVLLYAPKSYGFKTIFTNITFGQLSFFAICVGYSDDEEIRVRLYYEPVIKNKTAKQPLLQITNIYKLLEIVTSSINIENNFTFKFIFDTSLPEFLINQNNFSTLVRIFLETSNKKDINLSLKIKIGEFIKILETRHQIIELIMDIPISVDISTISQILKANHIKLYTEKNKICLHIPLIKE